MTMRVAKNVISVAVMALLPTAALSEEIISYSYDAKGRLISVNHSGTVNDGLKAAYTLDKVSNRTNVTVTGSASEVWYGTDAADIYHAGTGDDELHGLGGNDELRGQGGNDRVYGENGDDVLFGGPGYDYVEGGDGNDNIVGGSEDDDLHGEAGNDRLMGALGKDKLTGGPAGDTFRYERTSDSAVGAADTIRDFAQGTDKIDLSVIDADSALADNQAFSFIGSNPFSGKAGELRAYKPTSGSSLVEGDVNGDAAADFQIEVVSGSSLVATDFIS